MKRAHQVFCATLASFKTASGRNLSRLNRKRRFTGLCQIVEPKRRNFPRGTLLKRGKRECIERRTPKGALSNIERIGADVEAIGVGSDQGLITQTRTGAEVRVAVVGHIEREEAYCGQILWNYSD